MIHCHIKVQGRNEEKVLKDFFSRISYAEAPVVITNLDNNIREEHFILDLSETDYTYAKLAFKTIRILVS